MLSSDTSRISSKGKNVITLECVSSVGPFPNIVSLLCNSHIIHLSQEVEDQEIADSIEPAKEFSSEGRSAQDPEDVQQRCSPSLRNSTPESESSSVASDKKLLLRFSGAFCALFTAGWADGGECTDPVELSRQNVLTYAIAVTGTILPRMPGPLNICALFLTHYIFLFRR